MPIQQSFVYRVLCGCYVTILKQLSSKRALIHKKYSRVVTLSAKEVEKKLVRCNCADCCQTGISFPRNYTSNNHIVSLCIEKVSHPGLKIARRISFANYVLRSYISVFFWALYKPHTWMIVFTSCPVSMLHIGSIGTNLSLTWSLGYCIKFMEWQRNIFSHFFPIKVGLETMIFRALQVKADSWTTE